MLSCILIEEVDKILLLLIALFNPSYLYSKFIGNYS